MLLRQQKDQDVYRRFRKTCCFKEIRDSGILLLSIPVIYLTKEMHLNIAINTSVSMLSDLEVCRLTKNEFKYMFLITWRPQRFLVLFLNKKLKHSPFFSFEVFTGKIICSIHVQIWRFRILWKKRCSDVWIVPIKCSMKVAAGKLMHACCGLLCLSGTCFLSSKTHFLYVL